MTTQASTKCMAFSAVARWSAIIIPFDTWTPFLLSLFTVRRLNETRHSYFCILSHQWKL